MAYNKVEYEDFAAEFMRLVYDDDFVGAESFLHRIDEQNKMMIVADKQKVNPMLFFAAGKGNKAMVEFLVKDCQADTEEAGKYFFDSTHSGTPLWCAAEKGRLEVVKLLQELGADINAVSYTEATPVNHACSKRQTETVKFLVRLGADIHIPNVRGETCLMSSVHSLDLCQFLIDNGARVNAQDNLGNTALHHAIKDGNLRIVKLLLDRGSNQNIENEEGDDALRFACLHGRESILMELKVRQKPTPSRWIESLHLLGSYFLLKGQGVWKALAIWRKSFTFQMSNPCAELRKIESMPVFINAKEVNTVEELEDLCQDQEMVHMYALEKLLRILGPGHRETTRGLVNVSAIFTKNNHNQNYRRHFDLLKYAFQCLQDCCRPTWTEEYLYVLRMLCEACFELLRETRFQLEFHDVFEILELLTSKVKPASTMNIGTGMSEISEFMRLIVSSVFFLVKVNKSTDQLISFEQAIYGLVQSQIRDMDGRTLLHHAIMQCDTYPGVVDVLLKCGADVNSVDSQHNSPFHSLAIPFASSGAFYEFIFPEEKKRVIKLLLQYSAHPDIVNDHGDFAAAGLPLNMLDHVSLQCLATAVIRDHQIPYVGQIPESLEAFVHMHGRRPTWFSLA